MFAFLFLILGLLGLSFGGSFLVSSTYQLSRKWDVKPLFLSIVILGMGTSAPECLVTIYSVLTGSADMALGNVVGSNVSNILLILGFSGLFYVYKTDRQIIQLDLPYFFFAAVVLAICFFDGSLSQWEAGLILILFSIYIFLLFRSRKEEVVEEGSTSSSSRIFLILIAGFIGLFVGAIVTVEAAKELSKMWNLSEKFVGLFILSVGTSLPELAVSLQAILKKKGEMALGNIVGSNIFNSFFVLGLAGVVKSIDIVPADFIMDFSFMLGSGLALFFSLVFLKFIPKFLAFSFLVAYFTYLYLSF